jgi:hypothetical protein
MAVSLGMGETADLVDTSTHAGGCIVLPQNLVGVGGLLWRGQIIVPKKNHMLLPPTLSVFGYSYAFVMLFGLPSFN